MRKHTNEHDRLRTEQHELIEKIRDYVEDLGAEDEKTQRKIVKILTQAADKIAELD